MRGYTGIYAIGLVVLLLNGCTTFHSAAAKGNVNAIERLSVSGDDVNEMDDVGITPLIYAVKGNQKEALLALIKSGANINIGDLEFGNTPLSHAILQGNTKLIRILVDKGADVDIRNKDGLSAVDLVKNIHNDDIIRLVQSHSKDNSKVVKKTIDNEVKGAVSQPSIVFQSVKIEPVAKVDNTPTLPAVEKKTPTISDTQARVILQRLMSKHETLAVRNFLNEHPTAITLISDPRQQLRYVGPKDWRIMDIAEGISRGLLKEKEIIDHIESAALPYKHFTEEEMRIIAHYGISTKIIDAMVRVTH